METIFIIGAVQAVFLSFLVLMKKKKMMADNILIAMLLIWSLHLLSHYMFVTGELKKHPIFEVLSFGFAIPSAVLVYIYVSILTSKSQQLKTKYLFHFASYFLLTTLLFIAVSNGQNIESMKLTASPLMLVFTFFVVFLGPFYMVLCLKKINKHQKNILGNFSFSEEIDLLWLKYVVLISIAISVVVIVIAFIGFYYDISNFTLGYNIIFTTMTIAVFLYGFFGIKQQVIYAPPVPKEVETVVIEEVNLKLTSSRYVKSGLKKEDSKEYLKNLLQYMDNEKPYLNGKLSLKNVALELGISTNHLSQVINENLGKNFFDFVNEYRVELVKSKMSDPSNRKYTILHLALECGFNSKSSFNTIFKKQTGLTPTEFMAKN